MNSRISFSVLLLALILHISSIAQIYSAETIPFDENYKAYKWEETPTLTTISAEYANEDALIIKDFKIFDYELIQSGLMLNYTHHKRVKVKNEKTIAEFSRVYIPISNIVGPVQLYVRTILPNGNVVNLDETKIKELKNVEEAGDFKIFAFEGVEPGCEVEYILKYSRPARSIGREMLQSEYSSMNSLLLVRIPEIFAFDYTFYNCQYDFSKKSAEYKGIKNTILFTGSLAITKLKEEEMAYYMSALDRIDYSIRYKQNAAGYLTWGSIAEKMITPLYPQYDKKVEKICNSLGIPGKSNDTEKIQAIETYIKNNISIANSVEKEETIKSILKNKYATETALLKLYMTFFKQAGIQYELVYTTDRTRCNFDQKVASWFFLENALFYFPNLQKFMSPTSVYLRYPMIPTSWADNDGLFIQVIQTGSTSTYSYNLSHIDPLSYEYNFSKLDVTVKFDMDKETANLDLQEAFTGEPAVYYQPYYGLMEEAKQKEIVNSILKKPSEEGTPSEGTVVNYNRELSPALYPFVVKGKLSSSQLLQRAGKKYIFNVGDVIGPQSEWYADTLKRVLPIQARYGHYYIRNIEVVIPDGYQAKNLESLNLDVKMAFGNDPKSCYFKSWYKVEGNIIKITIEEYYKLCEYPAEKYFEFREVINAAADFNKVTILLEEK